MTEPKVNTPKVYGDARDDYFSALDDLVARNKAEGRKLTAYYPYTDYSPYIKKWKELYKVNQSDD